MARSCPITRYCQRCDQRDHTSLCDKPAYAQRSSQPTPGPSCQRAYETPGGQQYSPQYSSHQRTYPSGNQHRNHTSTQVAHNPDHSFYAEPPANYVSSPSPALLSTSSTILMQTALVKVMDRNGSSHIIRLLFDTGSQRTYITSKVTTLLGLKPSASESLTISPFGQRSSVSRSYNVTSLTCYSVHNSINQHAISAVVVPTITHPVSRAPLPHSLRSTVRKLTLADPPSMSEESLEIDVLIGLDYYWDIVKDENIRVPDSSLTAIPSTFGYLLSGRLQSGLVSSSFNALCVGISAPNSENFVKDFWESESFDVAEAHLHCKKEADPVLLQFENTIHMKDGRYKVRLPWKFAYQSSTRQ